jgi:dihydropteroate synthase
MLDDGATFIDVGAYSSKPGADFVSEEEISRIVPVIRLILKYPDVFSIDTLGVLLQQ